MTADRRLTDLPLPPYTYVPGKTSHPRRDASGHSHGLPEPMVDSFDPFAWRECQTYLFGIDLYDAGFYWEAHEQWEAVWLSVGRVGSTADFLKALIKLAAAGVKQLEGRRMGVNRHLERAVELLLIAAEGIREPERRFCGFDLEQLRQCVEKVAQSANRGCGSTEFPSRISLTGQLR